MSKEVKPRKRAAKRPPSKSKTKATATKTRTKAPVKKATAKKTAPARKKAASKAPATKGRGKATTARKTAAKKTTARKAPAKKAAAKKTTGGTRGGFHRELDEHGFVVGGDSSIIASMLIEGGADRIDINEKVAKKIGTVTRNDTERNVPALVSGVLNRLLEQGYKIESSFQVVAPARKRKRK